MILLEHTQELFFKRNAGNRIIYVEGFLFYPNESKAEAMRELSILINTLKIQ